METEQGIDPAEILPPELMQQIFGYLDAPSLCLASEASKSWKDQTETTGLWKGLCQELWEEHSVVMGNWLDAENEPRFYPAGQWGRDAAKQCSVKELKAILNFRGLPLSAGGFTEKSDVVNRVAETGPRLGNGLGLISCKWKAVYANSLMDSQRDTLRPGEQSEYRWLIVMRQYSGWDGTVHPMDPRTWPNGAEELRWTDTHFSSAYGTHHWRLGGENRIQVGEFPPLTPHRDPVTWKWYLENSHVYIIAWERKGKENNYPR